MQICVFVCVSVVNYLSVENTVNVVCSCETGRLFEFGYLDLRFFILTVQEHTTKYNTNKTEPLQYI